MDSVATTVASALARFPQELVDGARSVDLGHLGQVLDAEELLDGVVSGLTPEPTSGHEPEEIAPLAFGHGRGVRDLGRRSVGRGRCRGARGERAAVATRPGGRSRGKEGRTGNLLDGDDADTNGVAERPC